MAGDMMLPEGSANGPWTLSGEIDIREAVNLDVPCAKCPGGRENAILSTFHFGSQWPDNSLNSTETHVPDVLDGFHTFGIVWAPETIEWAYDGRVYATKRRGDRRTAASRAKGAPFDRPFHLIVNLAIGGGLAEERALTGVDEVGFPKSMAVDWVQVWQCEPGTASGRSCTGGR